MPNWFAKIASADKEFNCYKHEIDLCPVVVHLDDTVDVDIIRPLGKIPHGIEDGSGLSDKRVRSRGNVFRRQIPV